MKNLFINYTALNNLILWTFMLFTVGKAYSQNIKTAFVHIPPVNNYSEYISKILVGDNEKIFSLGFELNPANSRNGMIKWQGMIKRSHPNGALDTLFGDKGKVNILLGSEGCEVYSGLIKDDGKILVAGIYKTKENRFFYLSQYTQDGELDMKFGKNGIAVLDSVGDRHITVSEIVLQKDKKVILLGNIQRDNNNTDLFLSRSLPNGALDHSFNNNGIVNIKLSEFAEFGFDIELQVDGKILIAGTKDNENIFSKTLARSILILRFLDNGYIDKKFGNDGLLQFNGPNKAYVPSKIQVINEHKIAVAGNTYKADRTTEVFLLILDLRKKNSSDLKENQITYFNSKADSKDELKDMILLEDSSFVLIGNDEQNKLKSMYIAHFNSKGNLNENFGRNGKLPLDVGNLPKVFPTSIKFHQKKYLYITGQAGKEKGYPSLFILKLNLQK